LKLSEKYENHFIDKAAEVGKKDFTRYVNSVLGEVENEGNINKRVLRKASKKYGINYQQYENVINASLILAPVFNYVSQSPEIRKSRELRPLRNEIKKLFQDSNLKAPRLIVEKAFGIVEDAKNGVKSPATRSFIDYMNQIEPQRESIIQGAVERLSDYNKSLKQTISKNIINDYLAYIEGGGSKQDAILYTLKSNSVKNESVIKRYLQTEAHEDFERAKIENAKIHGFKYKYWRTQRDANVRMSHMIMDGKIVASDENFKIGKHEAFVPGDNSLPIEERINCRCFTEFQFVPRGTRKGFEITDPKPHELPEEPEEPKIDEDEKKVLMGESGYSKNSAGVYDKKGKKVIDRKKIPIQKVFYDETKDKLPGWYVKVVSEPEDGDTSIKFEDIPIPEEWVEESLAQRANENAWERSYNGNPGISIEYLKEVEKVFKLETSKNKKLAVSKAQNSIDGSFLNIIKDQNFDKPPKVISKDELFSYEPEEVGMVLVRGYSEGFRQQVITSEPKNILKYKADFEHGDFFLDNTGGALYGKGMYTASIYNGIDKNVKMSSQDVEDSIKVSREYARIDLEKILIATDPDKTMTNEEAISKIGFNDFKGRIDVMHVPKDFRYIEYLDIKTEKEKFVIDYYSQDESKTHSALKLSEYSEERIRMEKEQEEANEIIRRFQRGERIEFDERIEAIAKERKLSQTLTLLENEIEQDALQEMPMYNVIKTLDNGVFASMLGYDGINIKRNNFMVILNRSKVQVVEQDTEFELKHLRAGSPDLDSFTGMFKPTEDNELYQLGLKLNKAKEVS